MSRAIKCDCCKRTTPDVNVKAQEMTTVNCSFTLRTPQMGYVIDLCDDGTLWLSKTDGEGMELTSSLKKELLELLDKFYKDNF